MIEQGSEAECAEVAFFLDDFLDQELPAERMSLVLAHLERCDTCRARYEREYRELALLRAAFQNAEIFDNTVKPVRPMFE